MPGDPPDAGRVPPLDQGRRNLWAGERLTLLQISHDTPASDRSGCFLRPHINFALAIRSAADQILQCSTTAQRAASLLGRFLPKLGPPPGGPFFLRCREPAISRPFLPAC